jgi:hypothetical protein
LGVNVEMASAAKDVHKEVFMKVLNLDLVQINNGHNSLAYYIMTRVMDVKRFYSTGSRCKC